MSREGGAVSAVCEHLPMIRRNAAPVLHFPPSPPWTDRITRRVPDALAKNDVLEFEAAVVAHRPFGHALALIGLDLCSPRIVSTHTYSVS